MEVERHATLGDNVYPLNYNLTFEPNLKSFKTKVSERITCMAKKPVNRIRLNSKEIKVLECFVISGGKKQRARIKVNEKAEEIELLLGMQVRGEIEILINAVCINNDKLYGFYRSRYEFKGRKGYILTSQFEAVDARAAFPCFDEPAFKATFDVTMIIEKDLDAVSNMPRKFQRGTKNNKKIVVFERTPRMSNYLLYLGVGRYERVEGKLGKLKIRVLTVPGKKRLAKLPLVYAKKLIAWYQRYFGIDFPLPKLDLIGVPDFAVGAMENWGAIVFRETALLGDENNSVDSKQWIAIVMGHEIAHQWFGDMVTMRWWNDLWLNESFAEYMGYKSVGEVFPKWEMDTQYIEDTLGLAFSADAFKSTHPISVRVNTPHEIDSLVDRISYEKGGSVLYMLEDYVGKETFRRGLHSYLKKHAYSNATKSDLWNAIQEATKRAGKRLEVSKIMQAWVDKLGHPIVEVRSTPNYFLLNQKRFTLLEEPEGEWPIPLHYLSSNGTSTVLMESKRYVLKDNSDWIKLNYGQKGLYRVRYSAPVLLRLGKFIGEKKMGAVDAWGIENDLFSFTRSGRMSLSEYLAFVKDYCMDASYPLDSSISGHLGWLLAVSYGKDFFERVREVNVMYNKHLLERLGWERKEGERSTDTMLRGDVIARLGIAGDKETNERTMALFEKFVKRSEPVEVNLRSAVYRLAAWNGDSKTFEMFVKRYREETLPEEKRRFLGALGAFRNPKMISKALSFSNSTEVRLQDSLFIPAAVSNNWIGKSIVWPWTRRNWRVFMKRYNSGTHMLYRMVENLSLVSETKTRNEIEKFFGNRSNVRADIQRTIAQALERMEANIRFMDRNKE